jgi:molybdopterin-containing oxidoreductase family iron-sulfur binding subunit
MVVKQPKRRNDGGLNAYSLYKGFDNVQSVTLAKADGEHEFACVQGQKTLMEEDIIKETL